MFQHSRSDGRSADYQRAIGHGLGNRGIFAGSLQHGVSFHGGAGLSECDLVRIHQTKLGESEVAHGARGGSDVEGIARRYQDDFERAHGVCGGSSSRRTASRTPLMNATDSSPENWRASSRASSITTAGGVFNWFISYVARRRMLRSTTGMRSMRQCADFALMR